MNESLQLSKVANRLLRELDDIDEDRLIDDEDVEARRMEVVLEASLRQRRPHYYESSTAT